MELVGTPYDDVFRTMVNDCSQLMLPMINEMFGEHYVGTEEIVFEREEHFLNQQDGKEVKRIVDSTFTVKGSRQKTYHWECQSTEDAEILIRFFEYDTQIALDKSKLKGNRLYVEFPESALLQLRGGKINGCDEREMHITIHTQGGNVSYPIPVLYMKNYTIEMIFGRKLYFLIPFYIFVHEKELMRYNQDRDSLQKLMDIYRCIMLRLNELVDSGEITEYAKCMIRDMSRKVLEHIAVNFENVREGVESVMGGQILEYEAKDILNRGKLEILKELVNDGLLRIQDAAERAGMSVSDFEKLMTDIKR